MTGSAPKKVRIRGPKKPPELFESPYAEQLKNLYKAQKFKGRPPENSAVLLGRLIKAGHFPWLEGPAPDWVTSLIDGGAAYQQYLADRSDELTKLKLKFLDAAQLPSADAPTIVTGTSRKDAGIKSGVSRREKAKREGDLITSQFQMATKTVDKKPDAFVVAKWQVQRTAPDLSESETKRQIRNLTKRLRESNSAI
jgi:hypothetical protein